MKGSALILGTSSGAGKSTLVTGLCRWLSRQGVAVAPFKAQNMSLNSYVTSGGGEIGRAQATQARAARIEPDVRMNPVLLKPGTESSSQLVVMGQPVGELHAATGWRDKADLLDVVLDAYRDLRRDFDVVMCEGAGSPSEINLRASDIVNLGFARAANVPAILVGDIDRGGVFASLVGTLAVLDGADQDMIRGFVFNKFRGDASLLTEGIESLERLTDRPTLGVVPLLAGRGMDAEDSLDERAWHDGPAPLDRDILTVGVVMLPHASNLTDIDPLLEEPGVVVRPLYRPEAMTDCDLVILPGTRTTVADLQWLRERGFEPALSRRATLGQSIMGVCGGYQMLGSEIEDNVESQAGLVRGLDLLPVRTVFADQKALRQVRELAEPGYEVTGYEIHHGRVTNFGDKALVGAEGCVSGVVSGTTWHGIFENDEWRHDFLVDLAATSGRAFGASSATRFAQRREARIDALGDLIEAHVDTQRLVDVITEQSRVPRRIVLGAEAH